MNPEKWLLAIVWFFVEKDSCNLDEQKIWKASHFFNGEEEEENKEIDNVDAEWAPPISPYKGFSRLFIKLTITSKKI